MNTKNADHPPKSKLLYRTCYQQFSILAHALLPKRCHACETPLPAIGKATNPLGKHICDPCFKHLIDIPHARCTQCGLSLGERPQAFGWTQCRHCRLSLETKTRTFICANYQAPYDQWIRGLKYNNQHALATFLGDWMGLVIQKQAATLPSILIPVPSSANRLALRGYNQAHLIARQVGKAIARPVDHTILKKVRESRAQAELAVGARQENLKNAFRCVRPLQTKLHIGLVDDVMTTGATLNSCAEVLYKAGAHQIDFFAICRAPE